MNPPPLPQPTRNACRNCGLGWDEPGKFCPRCGAAQTEGTRREASLRKAVYVCGALFFGALGFAGLPPLLPAADSHQTFTLAFLWAFVSGSITLACIWKFFRGGN